MDGAALPEPGRGPVWWEWLVTQHLQKSDDEGVGSNVGHKEALDMMMKELHPMWDLAWVSKASQTFVRTRGGVCAASAWKANWKSRTLQQFDALTDSRAMTAKTTWKAGSMKQLLGDDWYNANFVLQEDCSFSVKKDTLMEIADGDGLSGPRCMIRFWQMEIADGDGD